MAAGVVQHFNNLILGVEMAMKWVDRGRKRGRFASRSGFAWKARGEAKKGGFGVGGAATGAAESA